MGREELSIAPEELFMGREELCIARDRLRMGREELGIAREELFMDREELCIARDSEAIKLSRYGAIGWADSYEAIKVLSWSGWNRTRKVSVICHKGIVPQDELRHIRKAWRRT